MRLQREVNSKCPFCSSEETEYFEFHHIDEDRSNNDEPNILLVCPTCHSKITKGDITANEVRLVKSRLSQHTNLIEIASVFIVSRKCDWNVSPINEHAFFRGESDKKSPFPIFNFTLINHGRKTVVMKAVVLCAKHLPSGINGLQRARVLKPLATYQIQIEGEENILRLENPIEVMPDTAFSFQVEVFEKSWDELGRCEILGRMMLMFNFEFSNGSTVNSPKIFLNCISEFDPLKIRYIH